MDQTPKYPQDFSIQQAMQFASSPSGKKLIAMLQQKNNPDIGKAADLAASGNLDQAKNLLSSLLEDPEIKELLTKFGG